MLLVLRTLAMVAAFVLDPGGDVDKPEPAATCPEHVEDLDPSALFEDADPRLRTSHLIVVDKSKRRLMLFERGRQRGCWPVGLGFSPTGDKEEEGDGKTPEGWYRTSDKPWSSFDHAIAIHYPNTEDAERALRDGQIGARTYDRIVDATKTGQVPPQRTAMGGAILIHGGGAAYDWTLGCVALADEDLLDLRDSLPRSMRAHILLVP